MRSIKHAAMLIGSSVILSACATQPKPYVAAWKPPLLPVEARQSETPSECTPSCLSNAEASSQRWQDMLTKAAPVALPASAPTTN